MRTKFIQKFEENDKRKISYYIGGNLNSNRCLLFLNGLYIGHTAWIKQQRYQYFQNNYKMLFVDYHGVGDSVEKNKEEFSFDDIVDDIKTILDEEVSDKLYVIGYSVGGMLALLLSYKYQEQVNGLILLNSGIRSSIYANKMICGLLKLIEEGANLKNIFMLIYPWFHSQKYLENMDMEDYALQKYAEYNRNITSFGFLLKAIENCPDLSVILEHILIPTFVLSSENDIIFPLRCQQELQARIKNCRHKLIVNSSHASYIENYEEVNQFIEGALKDMANNENLKVY